MNFFKRVSQHSFSDIFNYFVRGCLQIYRMKMHYLILKTDIDSVNEKLKDFDLDVKELTYDDFLKGDKNVFKGDKLELYKVRCQDPNYHAYGIIENDRLVYSTWFSTGNLGLPVISEKIPLLSNEGLLEDSYCDPIARGRGFHGKMNFYRIKKLYELGKNRVVAIVLDGNTPAFKVQFKSGFEELGVFYIGKFLGIKYCTLKKSKFDGK